MDSFGIIFGAVLFSILVVYSRGHVRWLLLLATSAMTASSACISLAKSSDDIILVAVCFLSISVGALIVPVQVIASMICPDDLIGTITAMTITLRVFGGAIAYAIYYSIVKHNFASRAFATVGKATIALGIFNPFEVLDVMKAVTNGQTIEPGEFPAITTQAQINKINDAAKIGWQDSYREVYLVLILFGGISVIASAFVPNVRRYMDTHIAVAYH
ncbi:hypothetical protein MRB53_042106 [Persea americana]|nr:hypothetical protein MRB53_042106 [Persea americana]